ncbi:hypothetical protein ABOONEI_2480 [Aciduliprofundum boonei T469]|nr:hypothetical protein ABOONEI_2480 [Aciduliprofundum boonei T469]
MIPVKIGKNTYEVSSIPQAIQLILSKAPQAEDFECYRMHGEGD